MTTLDSRPLYTSVQLERYLVRIDYGYPLEDVQDAITRHPLKALERLQKYQMAAVPFENLYLHYSRTHLNSIEAPDLYIKIVEKGHGGYCMENNCFFGTVLRSLGFNVYSVGSRVSYAADGSGAKGYKGWGHTCMLVIVEGKKYMVDVGFGGNGPIRPLLLEHDTISKGTGPAEMRLLHTNIEQNTNQDQRLWVYQYRYDSASPWLDTYCFTELEFLPEDYAVMNHFTGTQKRSWFTWRITCVKTILEKDDVIGVLMLVEHEVKRRINGKTELILTCETENDRVQALEKYFGIALTAEERRGIRGMVTELKSR